MDELPQKQILLLAPDLLGESLSLQLSNEQKDLNICLKPESLTRHPSLVIWSIDSLEASSYTKNELRRLNDKWKPAPILLLLPANLRTSSNLILEFECAGLLQDPDIFILKQAITALLKGGRVVKLRDEFIKKTNKNNPFYSLISKILSDSLKTIERDLSTISSLLILPQTKTVYSLFLQARRRELNSAKSLILWIWSPFNHELYLTQILSNKINKISENQYSTDILLHDRKKESVIEAIFTNVINSLEHGLTNNTGLIFAFESLHQSKQSQLQIELLSQLKDVLQKLSNHDGDQDTLINTWHSLQIELRHQSVRKLVGSYERLIYNSELVSIADTILSISDFTQEDEELPDPHLILDPLLLNKPLNVKGQYLPVDDPRALMKLQLLITNWLIRNSELVSSELINTCSIWPNLRNYLLKDDFIPTRELERFRNHLNSQNRFFSLIKRPIELYESKRSLYEIKNNTININVITAPRDDELLKLNWWQRQVALLVEARDALAPQVQALVKHLGSLMVVILTNILGRALGLVGKGIAQGMGRRITNK